MNKRSAIFLLFFLLLAIAAVSAQTVQAQEVQPTPSDDEVNRVAKQMYCPVCENIPLDVCPTTACAEWRDLIRLKLSEGYTDQEIKDYFAVQYGDRVLAEPPRRGLNWLVYVLPAIFFLGGLVILSRVLTSMRRKTVVQSAAPAADAPPAAVDDDTYIQQLEDELKKKD
jgi:cytochrome c-type biogenesis protein CcmH